MGKASQRGYPHPRVGIRQRSHQRRLGFWYGQIAQDLGRDPPDPWVGISYAGHYSCDRLGILLKTSKGLFFAVEDVRMASPQRLHQGLRVGAPGSPNDVSGCQRQDSADQVHLLRLQLLLSHDQDQSGQGHSQLGGDSIEMNARA